MQLQLVHEGKRETTQGSNKSARLNGKISVYFIIMGQVGTISLSLKGNIANFLLHAVLQYGSHSACTHDLIHFYHNCRGTSRLLYENTLEIYFADRQMCLLSSMKHNMTPRVWHNDWGWVDGGHWSWSVKTAGVWIDPFFTHRLQRGTTVTRAVAEDVRLLLRQWGLPHQTVWQQVLWRVQWQKLHIRFFSCSQEVSCKTKCNILIWFNQAGLLW